MFGSIFRMRPKAGRTDDVVALLEEWWVERGPYVPGASADYLFASERQLGELIGVVVFTDRASYQANAADPEQDQWYRRLRDALETDPVWEDGDILGGHTVTGAKREVTRVAAA